MVERIVDFLRPYFAEWGYLIVGAATFLENSIGAGLVFPGETLVILGGFYAATGDLSIVGVIAVACVGGVLGDNTGYLLGRRAGRPFLERRGRWFRVTPERLLRAELFYARHGGKTVFLARFVPVVRSVACLLAGAAHMRYSRFFFWDLLGATLWAIGNGLVGFLVGQSYPLIERYLRGAGLVAAALLAGAILLSIWWKRRRTAAKEEDGSPVGTGRGTGG